MDRRLQHLHVLIAVQNCIVRAGIKVLLTETRSWQSFQVTEAGSTEQAIALLSETAFDIVLLECGLPGVGGIKATAGHRKPMAADLCPGYFVWRRLPGG